MNWTHESRDPLFENHRGAARISACGTYRYALLREWDPDRPALVYIMLNPSTADHEAEDPTVTRCVRRALGGPWGGVAVVNLFALRSTDPEALYSHHDPVGPENDAAILERANAAGRIVCAWGEHGKLRGRSAAVVNLLRSAGLSFGYLKMNKSGEPAHPLYLPYDLKWIPWEPS